MLFTSLTPSSARYDRSFPQSLKPEPQPAGLAPGRDTMLRGSADSLFARLSQLLQAAGNQEAETAVARPPRTSSEGTEVPEPIEPLPGAAVIPDDQEALDESLRQLEAQADYAHTMRELRRLEILANERSVIHRQVFVDIFARHRPCYEVRSGGPSPHGFEGSVELYPLSPAESQRIAAALAADEAELQQAQSA